MPPSTPIEPEIRGLSTGTLRDPFVCRCYLILTAWIVEPASSAVIVGDLLKVVLVFAGFGAPCTIRPCDLLVLRSVPTRDASKVVDFGEVLPAGRGPTRSDVPGQQPRWREDQTATGPE
jgi:hypothetical protein